MIINLLHTLILATSVGLRAVAPSFEYETEKTEIKKQVNRANAQINYTETTSQTNWETTQNIIFSKDYDIYDQTNVDEITKGQLLFNYQKSTTSTTYSNPTNYLRINSETQVQQYIQKYTYADSSSTYTGFIPKKQINDTTLMDEWRINENVGQDTFITRYFDGPLLIKTKLEITPTNGNINMSLGYLLDQGSYNLQIQNAPQLYTFSANYIIFITTEQIENITVSKLQNNEYYKGQKYTGRTTPKQQTNNVAKYNFEIEDKNIQIVANTKNYVYIFMQPAIFTTTIDETENPVLRYYKITNTLYGYLQQQTTEQTHTIGNATSTIKGTNVELSGYEVIDMGGLVFTILGMPFTFISTAFDLTLFQGTPYQINFSTLFLSVFAVVVFVFIVKLILGAIGNK